MADTPPDFEANPDLLAFNGINGASGDYGIPPMTEKEFARNLGFDLEAPGDSFGVGAGIDPGDLAQAGWGVIFVDGDPNVEAIKEALSELLDLRQEQAFGPFPEKPNKETEKYFKIFEGADGYRPGDSKRSFLGRHGVASGPVYPENGVPYYLLLVGSPEQIPYQFQFQLSVQFAVGRIHFDTLQDYANYARSVVAAEKGEVKLSRKVTFFGVENANDRATQMSSKHLIAPLNETLTGNFADWQFEAFTSGQATKAQLAELLGGPKKPALLFTASHGMEFPLGNSRQLPHQGALLCQDWPGPRRWRKEIPQDFYFAGDDLTSSANLLGMVAFSFACYGAGSPKLDEFSKQAKKSREPIAPYAFLAELPRKLLSHSQGGALAFVGHVERAWGYSFLSPEAGTNIAMFQSTLENMLYGDPVGYAVEGINERYAELATDVTSEIQDLEYFQEQAKQGSTANLDNFLDEKGKFLVRLWTEHNDARDYAIIGDPAARLPIAEEGEAVVERPSITVADHSATPLTDTAAPDRKSFGPPGLPPIPSPPSFGNTEAETEVDSYGLFSSTKEAASDVSQAMKGFVEQMGSFLKKAIEDASQLEVTTYTTEDMRGIEYKGGKFEGEVQLRAKTVIKIDGDTDILVPLSDGEIDAAMWAVHLEAVKQAQESRNELVKTAVSALASFMPGISGS